MPNAWVWDPTLFAGTAEYYQQGRLPYSTDMAMALQQTLALDGSGRLLDVGSGPGTVALALADLFEEVVGLDPDQAMLDEAVTNAANLGISNAIWVRLRAEQLPADLGTFRVAAFGQSFHWMERAQVAATIFEMLESGGAFLHVNQEPVSSETGGQPAPAPPYDAIKLLVHRYLGDVRRAGQGFLPRGTPDKEADIIESAGFDKEKLVRIAGGEPLVRRSDDIMAAVFSRSDSAPHLFGDRLTAFEKDLSDLLTEATPEGFFIERQPDTVMRIWLKPRHEPAGD